MSAATGPTDRFISPPVQHGRSPHTVDGTTIRRACQMRKGKGKGVLSPVSLVLSRGTDWEAVLLAALLVFGLLGELVIFTAFVATWIGGGR